jgi:hypothetical protein
VLQKETWGYVKVLKKLNTKKSKVLKKREEKRKRKRRIKIAHVLTKIF